MSDKPIYAPIPARAATDDMLAARHWRTLAAIAMHDRFTKNGVGCYASHERLCELIGCDYSRLSTNLKELGEWGYIERLIHPLNKRLRVYRVLYSEEDRMVIKGLQKSTREGLPNGKEYSLQSGKVSDEHTLPIGKVSSPDSLPTQTVNSLSYIEERPVNIFRETENISGRNLKIDSAEAAPTDVGACRQVENEEVNIGAELAKFERAFKAGEIPASDLVIWERWLHSVLGILSPNDPNCQRAWRLYESLPMPKP